jgi:uncharacterized protein YggU (UPF0235/DUF167 family)
MIISAKVKTNQPKFAFEKGDVWKISVRSSPEKNQANRELVFNLSKIYSGVRIVSGVKSKIKKIELFEK